MKRFFAVFMVIFLLACCAGSKSDSYDCILREVVIHLDGMELIRIDFEDYEILEGGLVRINDGGVSYITSPNNIVIFEYDLNQLEEIEIHDNDLEEFMITGMR